jgi:hypothetical protein
VETGTVILTLQSDEVLLPMWRPEILIWMLEVMVLVQRVVGMETTANLVQPMVSL